MHVKEKKVTTKQDAGMLRAYVEIQDDGYFCKIVYHAVDDRQGKISRSKVVVMFNTSNLRFQIIWCHD